MESIEYLGRQLPLLGHYDTVVVGGGAAGAAAGIRCAIDGQKVLLVEKGSVSGRHGFSCAGLPHDAYLCGTSGCAAQGRGDPEQARRHHP